MTIRETWQVLWRKHPWISQHLLLRSCWFSSTHRPQITSKGCALNLLFPLSIGKVLAGSVLKTATADGSWVRNSDTAKLDVSITRLRKAWTAARSAEESNGIKENQRLHHRPPPSKGSLQSSKTHCRPLEPTLNRLLRHRMQSGFTSHNIWFHLWHSNFDPFKPGFWKCWNSEFLQYWHRVFLLICWYHTHRLIDFHHQLEREGSRIER
jgi:hypothetical protein